MRRWILTLGLLSLLAPQLMASDATVELSVVINGVSEEKGQLAIAVFDSESSYDDLSSPLRRNFVPLRGLPHEWTTVVPAGRTYAVVAYHDLNSNGRLDKGRMGVPREPYGFSNNARSLFGPPSYTDASFNIAELAASIEINLR